MRSSLTVLLVVIAAVAADAAEVKPISWETTHAAPAAKLDEKSKDLLPLIRLGVSALPEATVMQMTFIGGSALGLPSEDASALHSLLSTRYQEIAADETFSKLPSALPYCYSATKPTSGFASVYLPDAPTADTNVILFLHGYGGSFTFYQHYLADAFPEHIIICPAYGISSSNISSAYLQECMVAVAGELGFRLSRPVLIGLSAGGFGGFREYSRRSTSYLGYICIAAFPPDDVLARIPRTGRIRLVAGGDESFVKNRALQRVEHSLKRRLPDYSSHLIADHGHFFMLGAEPETKKLLKQWNAQLQTKR
ncbi:MAG: alpha/beta hydrolase [Verrucomicrobiota bacterium]